MSRVIVAVIAVAVLFVANSLVLGWGGWLSWLGGFLVGTFTQQFEPESGDVTHFEIKPPSGRNEYPFP